MHGERTLRTDGLDFAEWREGGEEVLCDDFEMFSMRLLLLAASK